MGDRKLYKQLKNGKLKYGVLWRYTAGVTQPEGGGGEVKGDAWEVIIKQKPRGWVGISQAKREKSVLGRENTQKPSDWRKQENELALPYFIYSETPFILRDAFILYTLKGKKLPVKVWHKVFLSLRVLILFERAFYKFLIGHIFYHISLYQIQQNKNR